LSVKLRLKRMGKKKYPFYRIVTIDSRTSRDGKYIDKIGHYNPMTNPAEIVINEERALYWLKQGAIPSETVRSLLSRKGILLKYDLIKKGADKEKCEEEMKRWELLQLEREKRKEAEEIQKVREKADQKEVTSLEEDHKEGTTEDIEEKSD